MKAKQELMDAIQTVLKANTERSDVLIAGLTESAGLVVQLIGHPEYDEKSDDEVLTESAEGRAFLVSMSRLVRLLGT